jgi:hypothetical protein
VLAELAARLGVTVLPGQPEEATHAR